MKNKISIEPLGEFQSMDVVKEILSQDGIKLVAVGSMACIASLQYIAACMGSAQQLLAQGLSAKEYSLGKNHIVLANLIQAALDCGNTKGIIVYCSCLDILTNLDENRILDMVDNVRNVQIAFLYRGPLVKRKIMPKDALKNIWAKWNLVPNKSKADSVICNIINEVDFKKSVLESTTDENILLITPGGCASCLYDAPKNKISRIYNTRFNDLFLCNHSIEDMVVCIEEYFKPKTKILLLGTAVIKTVGLSLEDICQKLQNDGYDARFIATDGFRKDN